MLLYVAYRPVRAVSFRAKPGIFSENTTAARFLRHLIRDRLRDRARFLAPLGMTGLTPQRNERGWLRSGMRAMGYLTGLESLCFSQMLETIR